MWLDDCRGAFSALISDKLTRDAAAVAAESAKSFAQPDDLIDFGHLRSRKGGLSQLEVEDQVGGGRRGGRPLGGRGAWLGLVVGTVQLLCRWAGGSAASAAKFSCRTETAAGAGGA